MFFDQRKNQISGASIEEIEQLRSTLSSQIGLLDLQIAESAAFSMAMVVRSALGLHADQASIGILYNDTLAGWIALATARHLSNAGCSMTMVECSRIEQPSTILTQLRQPLRALRLAELSWQDIKKLGNLENFLSSCHNLVCGISGANPLSKQDKRSLTSALNEHSVPVHCIEAPLGIDLNSGKASEETLYASSTLSLGIPYQGLAMGHDWVGRHYLADISLPFSTITEIIGRPFPILFSEQPVIQIFPLIQEKL